MTKTATRATWSRRRWTEIKDRPLLVGSHPPDGQMCVMEAAAYVAGERWSDRPGCVSEVIGVFLRSWNDTLDDADRQKLKPYIRKVIGTNTGAADEEVRAWMATDWLVRTFTPEWLDLAGLTEHAAKLRALPELASAELASEAMTTIDAARREAAAAWGSAWDALAPTVEKIRSSAFDLLDRMIAVGKDAA